MRKFYTVLYLAIILSCMAACGKNDTQAQTPSRQAEPSTIDSSSQSDILNGSENAGESSVQETERNETDTAETDIQDNMEENKVENMNVQVGDVERMRESPVRIQMSDYSGFEKVGSLGTSLPTSNSQTTTQAGDIVLYNGNQIVIFYGSNSWNYTRLGYIDDLTGWEEALGRGDVTVIFSLQ